MDRDEDPEAAHGHALPSPPVKKDLAHPPGPEIFSGASALRSGERVLVVVDEALAEAGSQLLAAARDAGAEPKLHLWAGERPLGQVPAGMLRPQSMRTSSTPSSRSLGAMRRRFASS